MLIVNENSRYFIPAPSVGSVLGDAELAVLSRLIRSGESLSQGRWRDKFEQAMREHIGSRYAMTVTSGTVAVMLAVHLLDLAPGDEVIVTPQTFKATADPLLAHDVTVRFCDVEPDTLNVDVASFESLITPRTRALILVHYGGRPARMDEIMRVARRHGVRVIEDCAHALGALYRGRRPGVLGDIGCFSFHSSKNITTLGEGGMVTFDDPEWAERIDRIRSNAADGVFVPSPLLAGPYKRSEPWMMWAGDSYEKQCLSVRHPGSNATLSEAGAAVGLTQLQRLKELTERRRWIAGRLTQTLAEFPYVRLAEVPEDIYHPYHLFTFFIQQGQGKSRDEVIRALEDAGVQVQVRYFPLHLRPEWRGRGHRLGECPVTERIWFHEQVNLPCYPSMIDGQVEHLVLALKSALAGRRGIGDGGASSYEEARA
ncbi:DegT/DnrJ/EryC1/StrS family aminotransferase [Streptomyces sp. NPDC007205]|uniref:DegT/DnrJ/EryC1/StrS aminotransferase family protein n=1 Tax=Streptomyces sp. NPDC007205 TaxID=3154316 RepID=UPI0033E4469B